MKNKIKDFKGIINTTLIVLILLVVAFNVPAKWFNVSGWFTRADLGADLALTDILSTDTLSDFPTVQNANNTAIEDRINSIIGTTTNTTITSLANLATVGTITTGVWNGTAIPVGYGGTGTTTPTSNQVMIGNGASGFKVIGFGTSGQFLTSGGEGVAPSWTTSSVDETGNYTWTGNHTFTNATSTYHGIASGGHIYSASTATSTFAGAIDLLNLTASGHASAASLNVTGTTTNVIGHGLEIITNTGAGPTSATGEASVTADCSSGRKLVGGGSNISTTDGAELYMARSYPSDADTWSVTYACYPGGGGCVSSTMTVYAICVNP